MSTQTTRSSRLEMDATLGCSEVLLEDFQTHLDLFRLGFFFAFCSISEVKPSAENFGTEAWHTFEIKIS